MVIHAATWWSQLSCDRPKLWGLETGNLALRHGSGLPRWLLAGSKWDTSTMGAARSHLLQLCTSGRAGKLDRMLQKQTVGQSARRAVAAGEGLLPPGFACGCHVYVHGCCIESGHGQQGSIRVAQGKQADENNHDCLPLPAPPCVLVSLHARVPRTRRRSTAPQLRQASFPLTGACCRKGGGGGEVPQMEASWKAGRRRCRSLRPLMEPPSPNSQIARQNSSQMQMSSEQAAGGCRRVRLSLDTRWLPIPACS
jgi:hypothetical protein